MKKLFTAAFVLLLLISGCAANTNIPSNTNQNSQTQPGQAELMSQYQTLLTENQPAGRIMEFIETNKTTLSRENMDKAVTGLIDVQQKRLKDYEDKIFSPEINIKLNSYKYEDLKQLSNIKEDSIKNLLQDAFSNGYKLSTAEGMHYLEIDYDKSFREYGRYVSDEAAGYLEIMAAENNKHFAEDAALRIGLDELVNRVIKTEKYISGYPGFVFINQIKQFHSYYLNAYLLGLNNTSAFDYQTLKLKDSFLKSYENTIAGQKGTKLADTLEEYLALLKKNDFKRTDEIIKFVNQVSGV